jgi:uncharacterized protein YciI
MIMSRLNVRRLIAACAVVTACLGSDVLASAQAPAASGQPGPGAPDTSRLLRLSLWMIITTDVRPYVGDVFARHMAYQVRLEKENISFGAGPVYAPDGTREYGMILIRAASAEAARAVADQDPMHREGFRTYVLHRWLLNEGRLNITIDFSDGTYTFK